MMPKLRAEQLALAVRRVLDTQPQSDANLAEHTRHHVVVPGQQPPDREGIRRAESHLTRRNRRSPNGILDRSRRLVVATAVLAPWPAGGCAIHYYDPETRTEHIWGFGHMQMRLARPDEGLQAVVRGTDVLGLSIGIADEQGYLTAGWHRTQRLDVIAENTSVRLEWPDGNFANVRVGSEFPFDVRPPAVMRRTAPAGQLDNAKSKESDQ